ncbi:T9SS type A sorting domain-containing protein, partial [Yeosuana marina]|uniref:T9SS type A sorting domain-containing protein n=1 Tax=Yeosuana marina TaxID=1565536 RepID=UPI0030C7D658
TGGNGTNCRSSAMCLDALGNVYTAGYFDGTIDFAPEINGVGLLTSAGGFDIFIQKRDASGNYVWTISLGGILDELALGISVDASGNIYTTGVFQDTVDFDPGAGTANLTSMGNSDIFVLKMNEATLGIEEGKFGSELLVYPNPIKDSFSIDLGHVYENTNVSIADINGRQIISKSFYQTQTINFPFNASAGIYLVEVNSGAKKSVFKLVKQ